MFLVHQHASPVRSHLLYSHNSAQNSEDGTVQSSTSRVAKNRTGSELRMYRTVRGIAVYLRIVCKILTASVYSYRERRAEPSAALHSPVPSSTTLLYSSALHTCVHVSAFVEGLCASTVLCTLM